MIFSASYVHVLFFLTMVLSESQPNKRTKMKDLNKKFAGMLKNLLNLNEKRFEAIKELAKLQDYTLHRNDNELRMSSSPLLTMTEDFEEAARLPPVGGARNILVLLSENQARNNDAPSFSKIVRSYRSGKDLCDLEDFQGSPVARSKLSKTIGKHGAKICIKACTNSLKITCSSYDCKKKMKKTFKKACKTNCREDFGGKGRKDSDSD